MKIYNDKKFCFIICVNNDRYLEECLLYLSLLEVPKGYETEVLAISEAASMAAGYNEGCKASDARYKIYLHQDTFIIEKKFLHKLLKVFGQDDRIGMVGMIGAPALSQDGVMWHEHRCGDFYRLEEMLKSGVDGIEKLKKGFREVEAADGLLLATRVDIPWREDILKDWDFYDVSQCLEFRRAGYKVAVPAQNPSWTIHVCGAPSFRNYEENRRIILRNYPEIQKEPAKKRILFFHSDKIILLGLTTGLISLGHHVDIAGKKVSLNRYSDREREQIEEILEEGHYDMAVTYDFCQSVSAACQNMGICYLAWVYDCPLLETYTREAQNPNNILCVFDRKQYDALKTRNISQLYHVPLATEVDCFGSVTISKRDERKYQAEIAFVGRLYGKRGYEKLLDGAEPKLRREAEEIVHGTKCKWDGSTGIYGKASEELIEYLAETDNKEIFETYRMERRYYFESMILARKANEIERTEILKTLSEHFRVRLYTDKNEIEGDLLKGVKICPWVDYWKEMPKVFHLSKINLNITSRSIESGISQRIFDALAVGGFMLTNYQPELEECFRAGVDLEVYHNLEELVEKAAYYLGHEEARIRIAMNGYRKVRERHSYAARMKEVLERAWKEKR